MYALLALASAAVFGAADFAGGFATRKLPVLTVTLISNVVGMVLGLLLVTVIGGRWTAAAVGWGMVSGLCGLLGLVLLYLGLARGPAGLVSPVTGVVSATIPVVVGLASGERPGSMAMIGLVLVAPAIWLVAGGGTTTEPSDGQPDGRRAALIMGLGAGLGFGLFMTGLAQTPDGSGAVPLLAARVASTLVLVGAALVGGRERPSNDALALPALAGVLDMSANGLFLWSTKGGDLAVVGALANLFPVTTIALSYLLLGERLARTQAIGVAVAIASAVLLT